MASVPRINLRFFVSYAFSEELTYHGLDIPRLESVSRKRRKSYVVHMCDLGSTLIFWAFHESDVNCAASYVTYLTSYIYVTFDVTLFYVLALLSENGGVYEV